MNTVLKEYLDDPNFSRKVQVAENEAPEVMLSIYILFIRAIRQGCSIIEVTDLELRSKKQIDGLMIDSMPFPTGKLETPSTMRKNFDSVLSRDEVIISNLELIQETEDMAV